MSNSIRFLGLAVIAWAGVRAISLGLVPGAEALAFDVQGRQPAPPLLPAVQPTELPPIEPVAPQAPPIGAMAYGAYPAGYPPYAGQPGYPAYAPYPVYVQVPAAGRSSPPQVFYIGQPPAASMPQQAYLDMPAASEQPQQLAFAGPVPRTQTTPSFGEAKIPPAFDRLQLSSWAMLRDKPGEIGLGSGGTLGGSQAGARLLWRFNPHVAASLRTSTPINSQRGGEAALGVRYQPFMSIPVAFTAERRKSLGRFGGRDAFAVFAEGGLYGRPMPWNSSLDAYLQSGIVGAKTRDWFVDGQAAVSRPVWRNFSAGLGVWGAAQPGISRLDAGPRASMRVGSRMRVHVDYRQKLVGNAEPGSGAVVTLAGDF
jgi:hypothetical protein